MPWVAGVDGCRAGWLVLLVACDDSPDEPPMIRLCPTFADVLQVTPPPAVMAVDIPIGLLDVPQPGGRCCDRQARRLLGRRASSVFSPPSRPLLEATHYEQVRQRGMSRQAFNIMPKIRQVDRLMTPALQSRVVEAHPELAFMALAGHPMYHPKKTLTGRRERCHVLRHTHAAPGLPADRLLTASRQRFKRSQVAPDDVLDACVLTHTAWRLAHACGRRVPEQSLVDQRGLRMEIWY